MYIPMFQSTVDVSRDFGIDAEQQELAIICKPLYDLIEEKTGKPVAYLLLEKNEEAGDVQLIVCYPVGVDGELTEIPVKLSRKEKRSATAKLEAYAAELRDFTEKLILQDWECGGITDEECEEELEKNANNPASFYFPFYADLKLA